jgi:PII-like signaling protein
MDYNPKGSEHLEEDREEEPESSMSSWLSRTASSHKVQLAATAVISGAVVAGAIFGFQRARRKNRVQHLKRSIPDVDEHVTNEVQSSVLH